MIVVFNFCCGVVLFLCAVLIVRRSVVLSVGVFVVVVADWCC